MTENDISTQSKSSTESKSLTLLIPKIAQVAAARTTNNIRAINDIMRSAEAENRVISTANGVGKVVHSHVVLFAIGAFEDSIRLSAEGAVDAADGVSGFA